MGNIHITTSREVQWMEVNPFCYLIVIFGIFLYCAEKRGCQSCACSRLFRTPTNASQKGIDPCIVNTLYLLLFFSCTSFILLETYYAEQCPIDPTHQYYNQAILMFVIAMFNKYDINYCAIFGTSLQAARNTKIAPWDHDSDFLIVKPNTDEKIQTLLNIIGQHLFEINLQYQQNNVAQLNLNELQIPQFVYEYNAQRNFIQIFKKGSLAHADIWLYENVDNKNITLKNDDYTNDEAAANIPYHWVFPTKTQLWPVYGDDFQVNMMNQFEKFAQSVFGKNYMTPYYHRLQCLENLVTKKASMERYAVYLLIVLITNFFAFRFFKPKIQKCLAGERIKDIKHDSYVVVNSNAYTDDVDGDYLTEEMKLQTAV